MRKVVMKDGENDFVGGMIFHKRVKRILDTMTTEKALVLDLNKLYLDSSVIGTLLAIYTTCKKKGIAMRLKNLSEETKNVLSITGVITLMDIVEQDSEGANELS